MKTMRPVSGTTNRLPGWGSPWKNPSMRTCLMSARMNARPRVGLSRPAASSFATSLILIPRMNSIVRTRSPLRAPYTFGTPTLPNFAMPSWSRRAW